MESIALIHTVKSVTAGFNDSLGNYLGYEAKIHNLWGDLLANNPNEVGGFTIQNRNRLLCDMKARELTGADVIITTCSTLISAVELIRPFMRVPVITIDDTMAKRSILYKKRIMVMATVGSTIRPTVSKIKTEVDKTGREVDISTCMYMDAFHAMRTMDIKKHDMILREKARGLKGYDCIAFAQTPMAHPEGETTFITDCPVLTSPRLCMGEIKNRLEEIWK